MRGCNLDEFFETVYYSPQESAAVLLEASQSPDLKDHRGITLLHRAIIEKDASRLAMFLELGCSINYTNDQGETPLHLAIDTGFTDGVQILVDAGADVELKSSSVRPDKNLTPLQLAVWKGRHKIVRILLAKGAAVRRYPLLQFAIYNNDEEMLQLLLKGDADVNAIDEKGHTPLARALLKQSSHMLRTLLDYKPDLNRLVPFRFVRSIHDVFQLPPLSVAVMCSKPTFIKELLEAGADPDCNQLFQLNIQPSGADGSAATPQAMILDGQRCIAPICLAARDTWLSRLRLLLEVNCRLYWPPGGHCMGYADPNNPHAYHDSALYYALQQNKAPMASMLLLAGFDLTRVSWPTRTMVTNVLQENSQLAKVLRKFVHKPLRLQVLCRNAIRESIGPHIKEKMSGIPLPSRLINYVLLQDLFDIED